MDEVIRNILKVEEEAKVIVEKGGRDADEMLEAARRAARKIVEDAHSCAQEQSARLIEDAVKSAKETARKYLDDAARAAKEAAVVDQAHRAKAAEMVIEALAPERPSNSSAR